MSSTTFAFALLAGNDLDKVAHTLNTITAQEVGADTSTRIVIAHDNADLTEEWVATVLDGSDVAVTLVRWRLKGPTAGLPHFHADSPGCRDPRRC